MARKRVIFTGQSGISIKPSLENFLRCTEEFTRGKQDLPLFESLERRMLDLYLKDKNKESYDGIWITEILNLTYRALQDLWDRSFQLILEEVGKPENTDKDFFLNFHACFYHHDTIEYLSFARESLIKEFNPSVFVTLIDDIYDVHKRLSAPSQIFHPTYGGASDPIGTILELFRILDWRSKEILMTRHLAAQLEVPHYVFAVKHPFSTLYQLIYEEKPKFYVSHPITEVRRLQRQGQNEKADDTIDEVRRFQDKISSDFTCFLPTAIDELRIDYKEKEDGTKAYMPRLTPRWDENKYKKPINLIFTVPPAEKEKDPLWTAKGAQAQKLAPLLNILSVHIDAQVSTRDHKLVEQSDNLAVYRPCFNGNPSRGVLEEIRYHLKGGRQNCFIYLPKKDQNTLRASMLEAIIQEQIKKRTIERKSRSKSPRSGESGTFSLNTSDREKLASTPSTLERLMPLLNDIIDNHLLRINVSRAVLSGDTSQQAIRLKQKLLYEFISDCESAIQEYKSAATAFWEEDDVTPELFVDKIINHLNKTEVR